MQLVCFIFGLLATAGIFTSIGWTQWSVTGGNSASVLGAAWAWRGLFAECLQLYSGQYQCEEQNSVFDAPNYLTAIRAMMCGAGLFSTIGLFGLLFGMECSKFMDNELNSKRRIMHISGFLYLAASFLTLASALWYTFAIIQEYNHIGSQDNIFRFEVGATLYVCYLSGILALFAGLASVCLPGPREEIHETAPYKYRSGGVIQYSERDTATKSTSKPKDRYSEYI